jgi:protein-tyrosine phosphatase
MKNITTNMRRRCANPLAPIFNLDFGNKQTINKIISPIVSPLPIDSKNQKTPNSFKGLFPEMKTPITPPRFEIRPMDQIIPNLWLGELLSERELIENNFTHVLSIYDKQPDFIDSPHFITKWINIKDNGSENISDYFEECSEFIHNVLQSGGKIYVHCQFGFSRSPAIVIAYIMRYGICLDEPRNFSFYDALEFVSAKRPVICPNFGFNISLQKYEKELFL